MVLFVPNSEENKLMRELSILSKENVSLISKAHQNNINVRPYVELFNDINEMKIKDGNSPLHRNIILKARIFEHTRIQKKLRQNLFYQVLPRGTENLSSFPGHQNNRSDFGQMHHYNTDYDIHLATVCLNEWNERARQANVDVAYYNEIITNAKVLKESYNPPVHTDFHDQFIHIFYVSYLYLYTNKIIDKVVREILEREVESLKENPRIQENLLDQTKKWLLDQLPSSNSFRPSTRQEEKAKNVLLLAEEKKEQILNAQKSKRLSDPSGIKKNRT